MPLIALDFLDPIQGGVRLVMGGQLGPIRARVRLATHEFLDREEVGARGVCRHGGRTSRTAVARYYIKVVPTVLHRRRHFSTSPKVHSHQYSYTEKWRLVGAGTESTPKQRKEDVATPVLPGVFWMYELSPFVVHRTTKPSMTLLSYITRLCAVAGGMVSISSVIHGLFERRVEKM